MKSFQTQVLSCLEYKPVEDLKAKKGKQEKVEQAPSFAIELADTVLFPEGGGQPSDTGSFVLPDKTVIKVNQVLRDKLIAKHITNDPIEPGTQVTVNVDWDKRVDYMQQHTGQHLLSAVFDQYDLETLSWSMGEIINYIELPKKIDDDLLEEVSSKVNELIFQGFPISVVTPDEHGHEIDTSHIPDDYDMSKGIIRVVKIGDMDANPCCGTHLQNTGQIQAISLLHQLSVRGGNSKLYFLCGKRVYKYLQEQNKYLKSSGAMLSCQIEEVTDKISLLTTNYKKTSSRELNLLKELAGIEAASIYKKFEEKLTDIAVVYRSDISDYLNLFQKEFTTLTKTKSQASVDLDKLQTLVLINGDYPSGTGVQSRFSVQKPKLWQLRLRRDYLT